MLIKHLLAPNKRAFWLAVVWTCLILFLSLKTPSGESKFSFPYADKIVHVTFYFVFVVLWFRYLVLIKKNQIKDKAVLVLIAISFGILIEILQHFFTTTRQADIWDALANTIGSLIGIAVMSAVFKTKILQ